MAFLGTFLLVVHLLVGALMCIVILMQASKGEGLSGAFGIGQGTSSFFGADTANVLVKITTVLAVIFMVTSLSLAYVQAYKARSVAGGQPKAETAEDLGTTPAEGSGAGEGLTPEGATTPEGGTETTPSVGPSTGGEASPTGEATQPSNPTDEAAPAGAGGTTQPGAGDTTGPQGGGS